MRVKYKEENSSLCQNCNLTAYLKKSTYSAKMTDLLSNIFTHIPKTKNPLKKLQYSTYKILKRLNDNGFLKYKFHNNQLTLTNTVLAEFHLAIKMTLKLILNYRLIRSI